MSKGKAAAMTAALAKEAQPSSANIQADDERLVGLNFSVPFSFRKELKQWCTEHDMTMTDFLKRSFDKMKAEYGK